MVGAVAHTLPRMGTPGSRSAGLHDSGAHNTRGLSPREMSRFAALRLIGTVGALLIGAGGLGAGALPVTTNPYRSFPLGSLFFRLLQTSTVLVFIGIGMVTLAWILIGPFTGARLTPAKTSSARVPTGMLVRTIIAWMIPVAVSAPMFTQDIYSYLAQGKIVARGLDPYRAGPVDLLGVSDPLARSVPFIWSHSPSPYGPVALSVSALVNLVAGDSILAGVMLHRIISVAGVALAAWAVAALARRCAVEVTAALWLGIANPLVLLNLVGGIHNEAILMGLALAGTELSLRGCSLISGVMGRKGRTTGWLLFVSGGVLVAMAGLVKVTGFAALGFTGAALARALLRSRGRTQPAARTAGKAPQASTPAVIAALALCALLQLAVLVAVTAVVTAVSGIPLGWITGQGGAASVRSWLSLTTATGVIAGFFGMLAGLGDLTDAALVLTRGAGIFVACLFAVRMLYATARGAIDPVGGWGVAMIVLVVLFPVVQPWYMLWAIIPLAAWANRPAFVGAAAAYSAVVSFLVLPRGLGLPPSTIIGIYLTALLLFAATLPLARWLVSRN